MDRLITILRAAHCRSTHHFFVVDALPMVSTEQGQRLTTQLLKHYKMYLRGAKAPDQQFRDFRNHVVHVNDHHWGGAPGAAQRWYQDWLQEMRHDRWSDAAYCAGVLSHYFSDPLMPLHTAQSEKESIVHRPMEWSVTRLYDTILDRFRAGRHRVIFQLARDDGWLVDAVTKGAELSNRHYDELIDRYDLERGTRRPAEGLDDESIEILAGLFGVILTGWARIIERAADESGVRIPRAPLSLATLLAAIDVPLAWIVRRVGSSAEQRAVAAIFDEYRATGTVNENLPPEVRSVREERKRDRIPDQQRTSQGLVPREGIIPLPQDSVSEVAAPKPAEPEPVADAQPDAAAPAIATAFPDAAPPQHDPVGEVAAPKPPEPEPEPMAEALPGSEAATIPIPEPPVPSERGLRMSDDLVDAPSIGHKTAKRLADIGITTVEQFLSGSAKKMARKLKTRWIKTGTIRDWQDQARLAVTIPGLYGYQAQLLIAVQCRSPEALAAHNSLTLSRRIDELAATKAGERILRGSRRPSREEIAEWIHAAANQPLKKSA